MPTIINRQGRLRYRGYVKLPTLNGQRRSRQKLFPDDTQASLKMAIEWEVRTKRMLAGETGSQLIPENLTDSDCLTIFEWAETYLLDAQTRLGKKTFYEKRSIFKELLRFADKDMPVSVLVENDGTTKTTYAYNYLVNQRKIRTGNATNKHRKNLGRAWNWGSKYITNFPRHLMNPFQAVEPFPKVKHPRYVPKEEDFWKVVAVAEGQDEAMLLTYFYTAARRSEIFNLQLDDIDIKSNKIRLWTRKRTGGDLEFDWLPMASELKSVLKKWLEYRLNIKAISHGHTFVCLDEFSFCGKYYGEPFKKRQHLMDRLCKKAEVKAFGFHSIRHMVATKMWHEGKKLDYIQAFLRHLSPKTTEIYLKKLGLDAMTKESVDDVLYRPVEVKELPNNVVNFSAVRNKNPQSVCGRSGIL